MKSTEVACSMAPAPRNHSNAVPGACSASGRRFSTALAAAGTESALRAVGALLALMNLVPTTQMLFGSDHPYMNTAPSANGLDSFGLPASDLAAINRGNAVTLSPRMKG